MFDAYIAITNALLLARRCASSVRLPQNLTVAFFYINVVREKFEKHFLRT
jgi:hypothetical protein